jgi:tellurite resistance protein TehA-like permease
MLLMFFLTIFIILKHLNYHSSIINRNATYIFFLTIFIILKHLNYPPSIINRHPTYFFLNYFYNFKTFKLSLKYHK